MACQCSKGPFQCSPEDAELVGPLVEHASYTRPWHSYLNPLPEPVWGSPLAPFWTVLPQCTPLGTKGDDQLEVIQSSACVESGDQMKGVQVGKERSSGDERTTSSLSLSPSKTKWKFSLWIFPMIAGSQNGKPARTLLPLSTSLLPNSHCQIMAWGGT